MKVCWGMNSEVGEKVTFGCNWWMFLVACVFGGGGNGGLLRVGYWGGLVDEGLIGLQDDGVAMSGFDEINCCLGFHWRFCICICIKCVNDICSKRLFLREQFKRYMIELMFKKVNNCVCLK